MDEYTLPTEPGYYLDKEDDLWRLTVLGEWVPESSFFPGKHELYAPFTRLMTESQWAKKQRRSAINRDALARALYQLFEGIPGNWRETSPYWRQKSDFVIDLLASTPNDSTPPVATDDEIQRHAEKQGVSWSDAWRYFERENFDMTRASQQYPFEAGKP